MPFMKDLAALALFLSTSLLSAQPTTWHLHEGWTFRQVGTEDWYSAEVPGVVHLDLLRHEIIPDPFVGTQEKDVQWIEDENWEYQTSFPMPEGPKHQHYTLQFDGLDTYAQVWLNGKLILESDNMFRQYKLEVGEQLQSENTLRIVFESPLRRHAERIADNGLPYHKTAGNDARPKSRVSVYTRKAPYQFGWDWGPRLVTSGIWQPVSLIGWDEVQLTGFHLFQNSVTAQQVSGVLEARFQGRLEPGMELRLVHAEDKSIWVRYPITERIRTAEQIPVRFDNLQLWWPHTLGKPHRYPLRLE
ncbi:MAG TPA: hypothetical protein DCE41_36755, partial [Cytophagales bacterium]|nr:hypothetical protein [Cytophagales bacterium]